MKRILIVFFVIAVAASCQEKEEGIKAEYRDIVEAVYSTATVEPKYQYNVFPSVSGIIESSDLTEGKEVKEGEFLFKILNFQSDLNNQSAKLRYDMAREVYLGESAILKEIEQSIKSAEIKLHDDSINYQRQAKLWSQNVGSKQNYEVKKMAFELAKNEVEKIKNNYLRTEQELERKMRLAKNDLKMSYSNSAEFIVKSKTDGIIYEVFKEVGESVSPQTVVAVIGSQDDFILKLLIDEVDISRVDVGQQMVVHLDAFGKETFDGKVTRIYPTKDARSQTFTVEGQFVKIPPKLLNGLSGEANIIISKREQVLSLPSQFINEDGTVRTQNGNVPIKKGTESLQYTEIVEGIDTSIVIYQPE